MKSCQWHVKEKKKKRMETLQILSLNQNLWKNEKKKNLNQFSSPDWLFYRQPRVVPVFGVSMIRSSSLKASLTFLAIQTLSKVGGKGAEPQAFFPLPLLPRTATPSIFQMAAKCFRLENVFSRLSCEPKLTDEQNVHVCVKSRSERRVLVAWQERLPRS